MPVAQLERDFKFTGPSLPQVGAGDVLERPHHLILEEPPMIPTHYVVRTDQLYRPSNFRTKVRRNAETAADPDAIKREVLTSALAVTDRSGQTYASEVDTDDASGVSTQSIVVHGERVPLQVSTEDGVPRVVNKPLFNSIVIAANLPPAAWAPDAVMTSHLDPTQPSFGHVSARDLGIVMGAEGNIMNRYLEDGTSALIGWNEGWSLNHVGSRSVLRYPHKQVGRYPGDDRINGLTADGVIDVSDQFDPDLGLSHLMARRMLPYIDEVVIPQLPEGSRAVATKQGLVLDLPGFRPADYGRRDARGRNIFFDTVLGPVSAAVEQRLALAHSTVYNSSLADARGLVEDVFTSGGDINWARHDQLYARRSPFSWHPFDPEMAESLDELHAQDRLRRPAAYSTGMLFTPDGAVLKVGTEQVRGKIGPVELLIGSTLERDSMKRDDHRMEARVDGFFKPTVRNAYGIAAYSKNERIYF